MFSRCWRLPYLILLLPGVAFAQAALEGTVHDHSGRSVLNAVDTLQHQGGGILFATLTDSNGKFRFSAIEAGAYSLQIEAVGYFKSTFDFVLRSRQPVSLNIELQEKETVRQKVEVQANYLTIDPEKTGSSYTFTRQDLERLPEPLI